MRNAEFDREHVLSSAMGVFMLKGYTKTSMQDLTKATGLHPGSIYCAFENKKGLLLAAIEHYQLQRTNQFKQIFDNDQPAVINLKAYLNCIAKECISCDASQSCLLTKSLMEIGEQDEEINNIIGQYLSSWQQALESVFEQAKSHGEIEVTANSPLLAQYTMMGIYGLRTFGQCQPQGDVLQALVDKLLIDVTR